MLSHFTLTRQAELVLFDIEDVYDLVGDNISFFPGKKNNCDPVLLPQHTIDAITIASTTPYLCKDTAAVMLPIAIPLFLPIALLIARKQFDVLPVFRFERCAKSANPWWRLNLFAYLPDAIEPTPEINSSSLVDAKLNSTTADEIAFWLNRASELSHHRNLEQDPCSIGDCCDADGEGLADGASIMIEGMVKYLFCIGKLFSLDFAQMKNIGGKVLASKMYSATHLINCVSFASMIKNAGTMYKVLQRAIEIVFPSSIADMLKESVLNKCSVPSTAVISRFRFVLDCGYMLWMRDFNAKLLTPGKYDDLIINLLSDSSPQGNENWQLTEIYYIYNPVAAADLVDELLEIQRQRILQQACRLIVIHSNTNSTVAVQ
jgi:hypothetical protein